MLQRVRFLDTRTSLISQWTDRYVILNDRIKPGTIVTAEKLLKITIWFWSLTALALKDKNQMIIVSSSRAEICLLYLDDWHWRVYLKLTFLIGLSRRRVNRKQ